MRLKEFAPSGFRASFGDAPSFSDIFGRPAIATPKADADVGINPDAKGVGLSPSSSGIGLKIGKSGLPVDAPVSSKFGFRTTVGKAHSHNGTDFAVPVGTPVRAPDSGVVKSAGVNGGAAGTFVILDAGGAVHKFFHLSKIMVNPGDTVKKGQVVALSGNTGYSTGPHLHWEKHVAGRPIDPMSNIG